jgi:ABC-type nitrate/sulfonate/bicarbonate transport system permease component
VSRDPYAVSVEEGRAGADPPGPPPDERPRDRRGFLSDAGDRAGGAARWLLVRLYPLALILLVWHVLASRGVLGGPFVMPEPARVWDRARVLVDNGTLQSQAGTTLQRVLIAYVLAVTVGTVLGILIGRLRFVRLALRPVVSFLFPTPKVALYPALVIIFGLGSASKIAFGFAEALFPVLLATAAATSQVEPRLLWSASALGTSQHGAFVKVVLPAALPGILTGARIALVGALIGVFLGEMIAGGDGLGHMMAVAYRVLNTADMYVAIVTVSLIGFFLDRTFLLVRGKLLAWSPEEGH